MKNLDKKLPQVPKTTKIGFTSAELLASVLGMFSIVIPVPTEKDLGIDMRGELLKGPYPIGIHFNVQCKGTEEVDSEFDKFSMQIKVSTINYWLQQKEPTFLVVVDRTAEVFYWAYPYMQIKDRLEEIQSQEKVNISIFKSSCFNTKLRNLPKEMMDYIRDYHIDILGKIALLLNETDLNSQANDALFEQALSMNVSIKRVLDNIEVIKNADTNMKNKVKTAIEITITKYKELIIKLDSFHDVASKYTNGNRVIDDGGFLTNITPREVISEVTNKLNLYSKNDDRENFEKLIKSVKTLVELNKNLSYFLREILYEINPEGNYEQLIEE